MILRQNRAAGPIVTLCHTECQISRITMNTSRSRTHIPKVIKTETTGHLASLSLLSSLSSFLPQLGYVGGTTGQKEVSFITIQNNSIYMAISTILLSSCMRNDPWPGNVTYTLRHNLSLASESLFITAWPSIPFSSSAEVHIVIPCAHDLSHCMTQ